jgi:RNA polymerase sigma factor (TIGR02999 family)
MIVNSPELQTERSPSSADLLVMVYEELRGLAARQMAGQGGQTMQPTALVHEAWMRLASKDADTWKDRAHFFRTAAVAMRRILVDRAREKSSLKRGGSWVDLPLSADIAVEQDPEAHILILDECLARMEREHPDCAKVVQLKFFAGLSNEETSALLGSSLRTVERQWAFARAKLYQMIRSHERSASGT